MATSISPEELYQKIKNRERITLIDTRTKKEFDRFSIYRSINIPLSKISKRAYLLTKSKELITLSIKGISARKATELLRKKGYDAKYLKGGLYAWNSVYDIVEVIPINKTSISLFQVKRLAKGCLSYIIIFGEEKKRAVIVDPSRHKRVYLNFIREKEAELAAVVDTHIHSDHFSRGITISRREQVPYLLPSKAEVNFKFNLLEVELSKIIDTLETKVLPTPGHTPESITITLGESFCLTGDTLSLDTIGRVEAGKNDMEEQAKSYYKSIRETLFLLDDDIFVSSSHTQMPLVPGPVISATLRYVKRINTLAKMRSQDKFVKAVVDKSPPLPRTHKIIKNMNREGRKKWGSNLDKLEFGDNNCNITGD